MNPKLKEAMEKYQKNEVKAVELYSAITPLCEEGELLRKEFAETVKHTGRLVDPSWDIFRAHCNSCETCGEHNREQALVTQFMDRQYVWQQDDDL